MREKLKHLSVRAKQIIFFSLALILAFIFSILLLPFILVIILIFVLSTWILIARGRQPKDIEIFPSEKPPYKSTSDSDLEIKIETLQRKAGKHIEPKDPSENP